MKLLMFLTTGINLTLAPEPTWAHSLGAHWRVTGDKVVVEAYFSDDTPAQGAVVRVFQETDRTKILVEVLTDETGVCSFARPEPGKYRIVVDAGAGHRKELDMEQQGPTRAEFTRYPLSSVILVGGGMSGIALLFWMLRRGKAEHDGSADNTPGAPEHA